MLDHDSLTASRFVPTQVRLPSSLSHLPQPKYPQKRHMSEARDLAASLAREAGFSPGTYSSNSLPPFSQIQAVYDGLTREIDVMIVSANILDLCETLYKRHEEITGHMIGLKHESVIDQMTGRDASPSIEAEQHWSRVAPYTETLRWLIEYCVKTASPTGRKIGGSKIERLIAVAGICFEWDLMWENLTRNVFSYELHVSPTFAITFRPTDHTRLAWHRIDAQRRQYIQRSDDHLGNSMRTPKSDIALEEVTTLPEVQILEEPLEQERGYKLSDWLRFAYGLIDSFEAPQYFKTCGSKKLSNFLARNWQLPPDRLQRILIDHAMSRATVADLSAKDLEPVANARRDSRLLRRPVISLDHRNRPLHLYGLETVSIGIKMVFHTIFRRQQLLPGNTEGGPLVTAIGRLQQTLGNEFRDYIANLCRESNFEVQLEKGHVGNEPTPQGEGFGPVDVFVVDRNHNRFVLIEVKDVADEGSVPKKMQEDRDRFVKFQAGLTKQTEWFAKRIDGLKHESCLSQDEKWSVDGVIVVREPRLWMYSQSEPLKIVHELQFLHALKNGSTFETKPTP